MGEMQLPLDPAKAADDIAVVAAYKVITEYLAKYCSLNGAEVENVKDSGPRVAKGFFEMVLPKEELLSQVTEILNKTFPTTVEGEGDFRKASSRARCLGDSHAYAFSSSVAYSPTPIIQTGIDAISLCPHHLLPIIYKVTYGYVSKDGAEVIGLSKFVRLAQLIAKRAVIQEAYTKDLVDVLQTGHIGNHCKVGNGRLQVAGAGAIVEAVHSCMKCRGVRSNSLTTTTSFSGVLATDPTYQQQFWNIHSYAGK